MLRSFWRWLTEPDPTPGFNLGKIGKLALKAFLFATALSLLQVLLLSLGLRFVGTWWGTLLLFLLLYIPFARYFVNDFTPPVRAVTTGKGGKSSVRKAQKRKKYAGVKKGGPRF
ncbi:hypothetical protein [Deinococcus yavapaiensis]|uniref:Uncharacterized protein n=1 Tax=Deinococcus yavapaiensis KR-236 TaxID=694435 RepID=A0A318S1M5_9DEIO|nr:hypothetical protein [Deinococcus yavapaiensis]PYE48680.1 hypothetical protein DES52_12714 [Deinococcus yavapaiensis KR-236]